jgi:hypothetical protein
VEKARRVLSQAERSFLGLNRSRNAGTHWPVLFKERRCPFVFGAAKAFRSVHSILSDCEMVARLFWKHIGMTDTR